MKTTPGILIAVTIFLCSASVGLHAQKTGERKVSNDQTCIDKAKVDPALQCEWVYEPVCGCDGKTYQNQCDASRSGVKTFTGGACAGSAQDAAGKFVQDWEAAYNAGDAKKLEAMYSPNAIQVRPDGAVYQTRASISSRYAQGFSASKRTTDLQVLDVVPLCDGKIWVSGIFTTQLVDGREQGVNDQYSGAFVYLLELVDGKWVLVRQNISDSDNENAPADLKPRGN